MQKKRVTVKDVAALAGVSIATVSRVINQNGRFSQETEQKVKDIIKQYDYSPNQFARSLRNERGNVIGIIIPDITNEYFAQLTLEIQKRLLDVEYLSIICNTDESFSIEKEQLLMLKTQRVSGLIYITIDSSKVNKSFAVPTIYIDRNPRQPGLKENRVFIESDNYHGGTLAAQELLKKGSSRLALVTLHGAISSHMDRVAGFVETLERNNIALSADHIFKTEKVSLAAGYEATERLLEQLTGIQGIFYTADLLALGGLRKLHEKKVQVPDEVGIVGFDDISASQASHPLLTTIHQSIEDTATLTVSSLMEMIEGGPAAEKTIRLPVCLVKRGTT